MIEKLTEIEKRFEEIGQMLADPAVLSDQTNYTKLMREHKQLSPIMEELSVSP